METLIEKIRIIEGSSAQGSVDLDILTNFPQVIMPHKFKAPEFIKYNGTGDPCTHLRMFCRKMAPNGTFIEFQWALIGNICCNLFSCKKSVVFSEYELHEDESPGESHRPAIFSVYANKDTNKVNCNSQLELLYFSIDNLRL